MSYVMKKTALMMIFALALVAVGCSDDEDFVPPSFLHIDHIKLVPSATNPITMNPGFYTHDITSCIVFAHLPGQKKLDTLGHFQLPFSVPVLYSGHIDSLEIYPAVKINGISATQPWYVFYKPIKLRDLDLTTGDTLSLDTLTTSYNLSLNDVQMFELFEPPNLTIGFDSVTWVKNDPAGACTGIGYGVVKVPDSLYNYPFYIDCDFKVTDATKVVYLELDTKSDLLYEVYMHSAYTTGGSVDMQPVMRIYPSDQWHHMYINLGRTWSWFNHNPDFRISFAALNTEGTGGNIYIDNVKLITTTIH